MRTKKLLLSIAISVVLCVLVFPRLFYGVCWQIYLMNPNIVQQHRLAYEKLSSEELIKRLGAWNMWSETALEELARRKEYKATPSIVRLLDSPFKDRRHAAIRTLAEIKDRRTIGPLMKIIAKGADNPDYDLALEALTAMKCEDAFPYVLRWARREDGYRNGSIAMLKEFGKPDAIPVLKEMQDKLDSKHDRWNANFAKKEINEAIKYIEGTEKEQSH